MDKASLLEDQARVIRLAQQVFGDGQKATRWLTKPKEHFLGRSPMQMLETARGLKQVEKLLIELQEGYF